MNLRSIPQSCPSPLNNISGYVRETFGRNEVNSENSCGGIYIRVRDVEVKMEHKRGASNDLSDFQEDVAPGLCYISSNLTPRMQRAFHIYRGDNVKHTRKRMQIHQEFVA